MKIDIQKLESVLNEMAARTDGGIVIKTRVRIGTIDGLPLVLEVNGDSDDDIPTMSEKTECITSFIE